MAFLSINDIVFVLDLRKVKFTVTAVFLVLTFNSVIIQIDSICFGKYISLNNLKAGSRIALCILFVSEMTMLCAIANVT